jgi:hypothetical protein
LLQFLFLSLNSLSMEARKVFLSFPFFFLVLPRVKRRRRSCWNFPAHSYIYKKIPLMSYMLFFSSTVVIIFVWAFKILVDLKFQ